MEIIYFLIAYGNYQRTKKWYRKYNSNKTNNSSWNTWYKETNSAYSSSASGFGLSPYTLLVDINIKGASGQKFFVSSNKFKVPVALTLKSIIG